jgi:UV radiation resistance-associated gene protein
MLDTWFSIHTDDASTNTPFYISEVMQRCMNPSFAFFDLEMAGPRISRSEEFTIRVWARAAEAGQYMVLVELKVNLRSLHFIGTTLEHFHHPLPDNCVLLHLSDGIYTSFTDLPTSNYLMETLREARHTSVEPSSSFDALMQLANLDECIQDALNVRKRVESDVDDLIAKQRRSRSESGDLQAQSENLGSARRAADAVKHQNATLRKRNEELRQALDHRRNSIAKGSQPSQDGLEQKREQRERCQSLKSSIQRTADECQGQIRRIGESLQTIFPIEPVGSKALQFTIRSIFLPNSTFDDTNRDDIAAALGFTAQLVNHLSLYLLCSLPYPISPNASVSTISDPISAGLAQRKYPLYPTNVAYKFEYGVFLMNKDIEFLMSKVSLRVLDIRHTLPNLKYLLYVLTAGSGELPARKAGGIRGLLGGRSTPSVSRRTSDESVHAPRAFSKANGSVDKEKMDDTFSGSPPVTNFSFRPSNLREAS